MAVVAFDDVLEHGICLLVLVTEHKGPCVVASRSAAGRPSGRELAAVVTGGQHEHGLAEIALYLVEHLVLRALFGVHGLYRRILRIVREEGHLLVVGGQFVVCESPQEQGLTLDLVVGLLVESGHVDLGKHEVAAVDHMIAVAPYPQVAYLVGINRVEVVIRQVPLLGGVPHLVAAHGVHSIADAREGALETDPVVAGDYGLLEIRLVVAEIVCRLVVRVSHIQRAFAGCRTEHERGDRQYQIYLFHISRLLFWSGAVRMTP